MISQRSHFYALTVVALVATVSATYLNPNCTTGGTSCFDCNTQKFCLGSTNLFNTSCSRNNRFCNPRTGNCQATATSECVVATAQISRCPRANGTFPDTGNCTAYTVCTNNSAVRYECPPNHSYNTTAGKCLIQLDTTVCSPLNCSVQTPQLYPGDSSLYYQCTGSGVELFGCSVDQVYNVTSRACQSVCSGVGLVGNYRDCSQYVSCESVNGSLVARNVTCPTGTGFAVDLDSCTTSPPDLCYEEAILRRDTTRTVADLLSSVVYSLLSIAGQTDAASDVILIIDNLLNNNLRPSGLVQQYLLNILPPGVVNVLQPLLNL